MHFLSFIVLMYEAFQVYFQHKDFTNKWKQILISSLGLDHLRQQLIKDCFSPDGTFLVARKMKCFRWKKPLFKTYVAWVESEPTAFFRLFGTTHVSYSSLIKENFRPVKTVFYYENIKNGRAGKGRYGRLCILPSYATV